MRCKQFSLIATGCVSPGVWHHAELNQTHLLLEVHAISYWFWVLDPPSDGFHTVSYFPRDQVLRAFLH